MDEQVALTGFEPPYSKELAAYNDIRPQLVEMVASIGGVAQSITIKHGKTYSSIWYRRVKRHCSRYRPAGWPKGCFRRLLEGKPRRKTGI